MKLSNVVLILISIVLVGCDERVLHNLTELEANKLLTALHISGLDSNKEVLPDGTWAVSVDQNDVVQALSVLNSQRLVKESEVDYSQKSSVLSSRADQRFRYERGLSREIERTLLRVEGILESRVHLNLPPVDPLFGKKIGDAKSSASVLALLSKGTEVKKSEIATLVAGASGILANDISVMISYAQSSDFNDQAVLESLSSKAAAIPTATSSSSLNYQLITAVIGAFLLILALMFLHIKKLKKSYLVKEVAGEIL